MRDEGGRGQRCGGCRGCVLSNGCDSLGGHDFDCIWRVLMQEKVFIGMLLQLSYVSIGHVHVIAAPVPLFISRDR